MTSKERVTRKVEWTIENITKEKIGGGVTLCTDPFIMTLGGNKIQWHLELKASMNYIIHDVENICLRIRLFNSVLRTDDDGFIYKYNWKIDDNLKRCWAQSIVFEDEDFFTTGAEGLSHLLDYGNPFTLFDFELKNLSGQSSIKLVMKFELYYREKTLAETKQKITKRRSTFSTHFRDDRYTDFTIKSSDEKPFRVHRLILAEKSDFFDKLFTTEMQEKSSNEAKLQNISSITLEEVIKFIYTGNAEMKNSEMAKEVLNAAEEFGIQELKSFCEQYLVKQIKKENALEMLGVADLFRLKELELKSLQKIMNNYESLKDTEEWKSLPLHLVMKVVDGLASNRVLIFCSSL